jgi:hypothetical protein
MSPSERREQQIARLHAEIGDRRRLLEKLEAEGTFSAADRQRSNRVVVLASAGAIAIAAATIVPAILLSRHGGAASAQPTRQTDEVPISSASRCPDFKPPPPPDLPIGKQGPIERFEDGGLLGHTFFNLFHPRGFSAGPLYSQHYELFRKADPRVRIWIGWRQTVEEADAHRYFQPTQEALRRSNGFEDLGATEAIIGCQKANRWKYERISHGERLRATRYRFVVRTNGQHVAYDVLFEAPATTYDRWRAPFDLAERSFRLNPGLLTG